MKIAFDSQAFTIQEYGGISRFICSIAKELVTIPYTEAKIFAPLHINTYLEQMPSSLVFGKRIPRIPKTGRLVHASSQMMSRIAISQYKPQIVHETYYSSLSSTPKGARCVVTVHDMIHERFSSIYPRNDPTSNWKVKSLKRADHIVCVSENTKRDLLECIQLPSEKVSVIHQGFDALASSVHNEFLGVDFNASSYLLYVGSRWGYKNFSGLLRSYASSNWLRNNLRIVCFGGGGLRVDELKLIHELGLSTQNVLQISGSDELLAVFYQNAAAFIYPSLYEGFGLPPLEAMSLRCPVICSNTSSIPEVVGDAGEYFDPSDIESITSAIENLLQSKDMRDALILKGIERSSIFTWKRNALENLAVYRKLV